MWLQIEPYKNHQNEILNPKIKKNKTNYHLRVSPIIYGMVTPGKTPFICVMMNEMKNKSFRDIDIGLT